MPDYYDLFVLLDPEAPEERRAAIVDQVKSRIDSGGASLKGDADWGMRRLSYEIDHRREAQYHLFQFAGTADVLTQLHRSLSIDDSVLRHRIIRLPKEPETTPAAPDDAPRRTSDERGGSRDRRDRDAAPESATVEPVEPEAGAEAPAAEPATPAAAAEAPAPEESPPAEAAVETGDQIGEQTGEQTGEAAPAQEPDGAV